MMKTKTFYLVSAIVAGNLIRFLPAAAQPFVDPVNVRYQHFPDQPYADDSGKGIHSDLSEATLFLPLELKNKDVVLVNADATHLKFSTDGTTSSLYSTSLAVGFDHGWKNGKWRTTAMFIPKINSDFKENSSDGFQAGGFVLFNYKKNDHLKYHFGAYYNREFFGDYFIPLLGIEWKINDRMNLFGDLPSTMNLEYRFGKKVYGGAAFQSVISSYRLSDGNYVREGDPVLGHDELKVYLNYYIMDHLVIYAEAGETMYRMFTLYDSSNHEIENSAVFHKSNDGMFYTAGLAYRIRLD